MGKRIGIDPFTGKPSMYHNDDGSFRGYYNPREDMIPDWLKFTEEDAKKDEWIQESIRSGYRKR
jgi:hypothetical protein